MHPQIHPGKAHQQHHDHAKQGAPPPAAPHGQRTKQRGRRLGVPAGEGIPRGPGPGGLHNGERGIQHPGPGNEENGLEQLVHHAARQPREQKAEAPALIDAPQNHQPRHHEHGFIPQLGDGGHQAVQPRRAQALQPSQDRHVCSSLFPFHRAQGIPPFMRTVLSSLPTGRCVLHRPNEGQAVRAAPQTNSFRKACFLCSKPYPNSVGHDGGLVKPKRT